MALKPKLADVTAVPEHAPFAPAAGLTLYRGNAVEGMNEEQLRATVRELLTALRSIAGAQSDRQRQRALEQIKL